MKKHNYLRLVLAGILLGILGTSCEYKWIEFETIDPGEEYSFSEDIAPIFTNRRCTNCHNGDNKFSLLPGTAYSELQTRALINTETPASSKILTTSHAASSYSSVDKQMIEQWIAQGALNN